jgi:diguanylate cyclase (GGDEF)-like protein/PAS domain S-box-containing protein
VNSAHQRDARDHSRIASLLLLLPMAFVALVSVISLIADNVASSALDSANQLGARVPNAVEHVHDVALTGTSYLVGDSIEDSASMVAAGEQVEAALASLQSSPALTPAEATVMAGAATGWQESNAARQAVLDSPANGSTPPAVRHELENQLNASLAPVDAKLQRLDVLNAADVLARKGQRDAAAIVSVVAIALAIGIGFVGALWLLRILGERQEAVRRRERRLSALVENASDGILVVDPAGVVVFVTPSFSDGFIDTPRVTSLEDRIHPEDRKHASKAWQRVIAGGAGTVSEVEARLRRRDGEWRHVWAKLTNRVDDPAVGGVILNVTDVSERHEFEKRLTHQALHDTLTGLPNRDLFRHRMERAVAESSGKTHSVLYLDCDDFKRVNDTLGHGAGDQYLVELTGRLVECIRPEDTVARLGGDEFAIFLAHTGRDGAVIAANRIIGAMVVPFELAGKEVQPSVSIGIASGPLSVLHTETLLADADLAMYFAKRAGKGEYRVFVDSMRTELVDHLQLGEDLRTAVAECALRVAYQPTIDMKTGIIVGAEALARWDHPTRGAVGPDTFIPLAEELGIVDKIDMWVLREACTQAQAWMDEGLSEFKMAVNLSGRDLEQPALVDNVAQILRDTGFPPGQLELELTEGVAINESGDAQITLETLKSLGIHLAIDDFGTGYSALSRLRNLPFDRLKVDKAFVDDIGSTRHGPLLVDTILDMAHVLGLEVVAEGVESPAQADYLRERDCDFAQGFLFNRPMPHAELGVLLRDQRPRALVT